MARDRHRPYGVNAYNLVGGASSANQYAGPTIDVAAKLNARPQCAHGGVTIAGGTSRRATSTRRWSRNPARHEVVHLAGDLRPGADDQAPEGVRRAVQKAEDRAQARGPDLRALRQEKTMRFIKWLGVTVPEDVEKQILEAENKVGKSVDLLCGMCKRILEETRVRRASA